MGSEFGDIGHRFFGDLFAVWDTQGPRVQVNARFWIGRRLNSVHGNPLANRDRSDIICGLEITGKYMSNDNSLTSTLNRAWPLYAAAFMTSLSLSICWTAMPFVLSGIGGSKVDVGNAVAINSLTYLIALLVTGSLLKHMDPRRATRLAIGIAFAAAVAMVLAVLGAGLKPTPTRANTFWIWTIIAAGGLGGSAMALNWPFLMSWVSGRYEGVALNRRFVRYNGSWSSASLIGPILGAWLVEINSLWPMVAAAACFIVSFAALTLARRGGFETRPYPASEEVGATHVDRRMLADFRWMSRIGLFCSWSVQAIAKSQFALLLVWLGYYKSQFGIYLAVFAACNFLTLLAAGRWAFWHYRFGPIIAGQFTVLAALLLMIFSTNLWVFFLSGILLGLGFGFSYSSHLYYGAATSRNRSVRMAIHETTISIGVALGAWAGGCFAEHVGRYAPYWFAVAMVCLGAVIQTGIHITSRTVIRRRSQPAGTNEPYARAEQAA
jgi:MFS family permease